VNSLFRSLAEMLGGHALTSAGTLDLSFGKSPLRDCGDEARLGTARCEARWRSCGSRWAATYGPMLRCAPHRAYGRADYHYLSRPPTLASGPTLRGRPRRSAPPGGHYAPGLRRYKPPAPTDVITPGPDAAVDGVTPAEVRGRLLTRDGRSVGSGVVCGTGRIDVCAVRGTPLQEGQARSPGVRRRPWSPTHTGQPYQCTSAHTGASWRVKVRNETTIETTTTLRAPRRTRARTLQGSRRTVPARSARTAPRLCARLRRACLGPRRAADERAK
jgi:hypothetical protein